VKVQFVPPHPYNEAMKTNDKEDKVACCPKCHLAYFYPQHFIAYYDAPFGFWSEAALYRCLDCGDQRLITLPLGGVVRVMHDLYGHKEEPDPFEADPIPAIIEMEPDPLRRGVEYGKLAKALSRRGSYAEAARYAMAFCRTLGSLSLNWYAWAVSLAEESGEEGLIWETQRKLLAQELRSWRELKRSAEDPLIKELTILLEREISRLKRKMSGLTE
jgi:hypothetical protein